MGEKKEEILLCASIVPTTASPRGGREPTTPAGRKSKSEDPAKTFVLKARDAIAEEEEGEARQNALALKPLRRR